MTNPVSRLPYGAAAELASLQPAVPFLIYKTGNQLVYSGAGLVTGWSVMNNDAANGHQCAFLDGTDANGMAFAFSKPASNNGTETQTLSPPFLLVRTGIYFTDAAVKIQGAIWVIPL